MRARAALAALAATFALWGGGCGGGSDEGGTLTVSAAASLSGALAAYGDTVEGKERFSFAGSDELAAQIRQGARPDLFASANTAYPEDLHREGLASDPVVFTRNEVVVAVPSDSTITSLDDLVDPGLDLVIGANGVPVGDYARQVLARLPEAESRAILGNVRSEESDVKSVVGKLTQGAADAGFVYASDVAAADGQLRAIELSPELRPRVSYGIVVVEGTSEPERAQAFVGGLLAPAGQRILEDNGFSPLPAG